MLERLLHFDIGNEHYDLTLTEQTEEKKSNTPVVHLCDRDCFLLSEYPEDKTAFINGIIQDVIATYKPKDFDEFEDCLSFHSILANTKLGTISFSDVPKKYWKNSAFYEKVLAFDGSALRFISPEPSKDRELVIKALSSKEGDPTEWISKDLYEDKEILKLIVSRNGLRLDDAPEKFKKDPDIINEAVRNNGYALIYVDDSLKNNLNYHNSTSEELSIDPVSETVKIAIKQNWRAVFDCTIYYIGDDVLALVKDSLLERLKTLPIERRVGEFMAFEERLMEVRRKNFKGKIPSILDEVSKKLEDYEAHESHEKMQKFQHLPKNLSFHFE